MSTEPNAHDFDQLRIIYSHPDNTTTVASMGSMTALSKNDDDDDDTGKNWGQLVKQSKNGRSSTYHRFNKDSSETLTHVLWTLEAAAMCPGCDHRFER
ncbi:MAG: hypothetical protein ABIZ92_06125 [Vicinamibacterales bacterium]